MERRKLPAERILFLTGRTDEVTVTIVIINFIL